MFVLKKLFELRDKTHMIDDEKPFLEHLEDLRIVITRIVLTLVIAMGFCFSFRNELMSVIRAPVEQVWLDSQQSKMPEAEQAAIPLSLDTWELAKRAARDTADFSPEQKEYYFHYQDPEQNLNLRFHTESVIYYRAAIDMENTTGNGAAFIEKLPGISPEIRQQVLALLDPEKRPDSKVDSRGKLVLMQALNPTEGFMLSIKLSLFAGIVTSFPLLLFFLLQFILPGLKKNEKKALWPAMAIGFGLFLGGVLFSYFYVLPKVLDFFYTYSQEMGVTNEWRIGYYISFATQFTLIFGLSFELPVVVMTLVRLGILNYEIMRNTRSYAILTIVIVAALITPTPDAFTLLLLAGPMILLYEICIWLAFLHNRKEREAELAEQEAWEKQTRSAPAMTASRDDDDPDSTDFDHHGDDDSDHYHYSETEAHHHDFPDHDEDEGDEEDTGTYDFSDDELIDDYSEDFRPDDCSVDAYADADENPEPSTSSDPEDSPDNETDDKSPRDTPRP